jgi:hypothetical protein
MNLAARQRELDRVLSEYRPLWHAQPFREIRPDWCRRWPALTADLLALDDGEQARLADDGEAAAALVARHLPAVAVLPELADVAVGWKKSFVHHDRFWDREIPGRKRAQIAAFAATVDGSGLPVIDWCGGKGHLGRLLARQWKVAVTTVDSDPALCADGRDLAARAGVEQDFVVADATLPDTCLDRGQHAVALHACGHLHRALVARAAPSGLGALDVVPCCYHLGIEGNYRTLSRPLLTAVSGDDARMAVTEAVTAAPRQLRQRDREMAWKLGFDTWRRLHDDSDGYRRFRPVPAAWSRGSFGEFMQLMARREKVAVPAASDMDELERRGWQRQREVMRLSIVRHAFRRPLEVWLALDLAVRLEDDGYAVQLRRFCERRLTPRNLLISARLR